MLHIGSIQLPLADWAGNLEFFWNFAKQPLISSTDELWWRVCPVSPLPLFTATSIALAILNALSNVRSGSASSFNCRRWSLHLHTSRSRSMCWRVSSNSQYSDSFRNWATKSPTDSLDFCVRVWKWNLYTMVEGRGWWWAFTKATSSAKFYLSACREPLDYGLTGSYVAAPQSWGG